MFFQTKTLCFLFPALLACEGPIERNKDGSCPQPKEGLYYGQFVYQRTNCGQDLQNGTTWVGKEEGENLSFSKLIPDEENCSVSVKFTDTETKTNFEGVYYYKSTTNFIFEGKFSTPECYGDVEIDFKKRG